ncbi:unnamed protein product [Closterium sp. Yama58-4]|nr:unnamed protein product [Closterium sp. Yama58-4]
MAARIAARLLRASTSRASSSKHAPIPLSAPSCRAPFVQTSPPSPLSRAFSRTSSQKSPISQISSARTVNCGDLVIGLEAALTSPAASPSHWVRASPFVASTRQIVRSFEIRSATSPATTRFSDSSICFVSSSQQRWLSSDSGKGPDVAPKASEADTAGGKVIGEGEQAGEKVGEQAGEEAGEAEWGTYRDRRVAVRSFSGESHGEAVLDGTIFDVPVRRDIVHRVVCWQLAKRRQGTHSTKRVGEVRGFSVQQAMEAEGHGTSQARVTSRATDLHKYLCF